MEINSPIGEEIQCKSAMEEKRDNKDLEGMETIHLHIKSKTQFDTICISGSGPTDFQCFEFDQKQGEFINVGGWVT